MTDEVGESGNLYLSLHCQRQNDSAFRWAAIHTSPLLPTSLTVEGKVTIHSVRTYKTTCSPNTERRLFRLAQQNFTFTPPPPLSQPPKHPNTAAASPAAPDTKSQVLPRSECRYSEEDKQKHTLQENHNQPKFGMQHNKQMMGIQSD